MSIKFSFCMASSLLLLALGTATAATEMPKNHPTLTKFSKVATMVEEKCLPCHTRNFELPFYAKIPGIKAIIEKDYTDGLRAMDLNLEFAGPAAGAPISEVVIAKMEWVIENDTMPPAKFTAVHWSSKLTAADKTNTLEWVKASRANHYATGLASPARANEPLQPIPDSIPTDAKKVALGDKLFHDKRLSGDNTVACVTCHDFGKAGTDGARFAEGVRKQKGDINAPTVFNAVFNISQFWNGRAATLQEQAAGPPFNPIEMDSKDWAQIIAKLQQDQELTAEMQAAYPSGWTGDNITDAIAEFEKTLITPNSPFDKWLKGDDKAISTAAVTGYQRFKAYRCASCHVGKSIGGQSFEYMDLKKDYFADRGSVLGSDIGLKDFTKKTEDLHKFKVPTLRNIALTAPYLHDGTVTTLDEAVRVMGVYLSGMDIPKGDRDLIVNFMQTLNGDFRGKPLMPPNN